MKHYDILIAGGGMVGSSLALALSPLGLRMAIVEAVPRAADHQPSFDDRSTALSRSTQRMFEAMGIWDKVAAASTPITYIHVSDRGRFGFAHIDAKEQGVEALGHVVINRVLGEVLGDSLGDATNLDVICPARITAARGGHDKASVTVEADGKETALTCDLLVAADGASSAVRDMVGIGVMRTSYEQCAIVGNLLPEMPMRNRASPPRCSIPSTEPVVSMIPVNIVFFTPSVGGRSGAARPAVCAVSALPGNRVHG